MSVPAAPVVPSRHAAADPGAERGVEDAVDLCRRMPEEVGVVGVPVSVFCDNKGPVASLVRFAFCKKDEVLQEAARRLQTLGGA